MKSLLKELSEKSTEVIGEAVSVNTSTYERSHGKPKGRGQWLFGFGPNAGDSTDYLDDSKRNKTWMGTQAMPYAQAKKEAMKMASGLGFKTIAVLP